MEICRILKPFLHFCILKFVLYCIGKERLGGNLFCLILWYVLATQKMFVVELHCLYSIAMSDSYKTNNYFWNLECQYSGNHHHHVFNCKNIVMLFRHGFLVYDYHPIFKLSIVIKFLNRLLLLTINFKLRFNFFLCIIKNKLVSFNWEKWNSYTNGCFVC